MNSREDSRRQFRRQYLAPLTCDSESRAEDGLRRCRTHCHDEVGLNDPQFRFQPRTAGCDLARVRLLMNSAFAAGLPFEVFYRVRDVNLRPIDSSVFKRAIHDLTCRTNEWFAGHIFAIARLFANQHHRCALRPFAKDSLGSALVQMTCSAMIGRLAHRGQTRCIRRLRWSRVSLLVPSHLQLKNRKSSTL